MLKTHARNLGWIAVGLTLCGATFKGHSEWKLNTLMQSQALAAPPSYDAKASAARITRARKLYQLWRARGARDVTKQVAPFLKDSDASLRHSAVRVLARLDTPAAERILAEFARQNASRQTVPDLTVRLALARVRSRKLRGQNRLNALAKSADLSWNEVVRLSQKVNVHPRSRAAGTSADEIVGEFIDLLSVMGRHGEKIEPFVRQLTLTSGQKTLLRSATLPPPQGANLIINYLWGLDVIKADDGELSRYLVGEMKTVAAPALIRKLKALKGQTTTAGQRGYVEIFRAAAVTNDSRVPALLKQFESNADDKVLYYAKQSRVMAENKNFYPPLP